MTHGPTDEELFEASQTLQDALWALADATGEAEAVGRAVTARLTHVTTLTALDPAKIAGEFDRLQRVVVEVGHREGVLRELAQAESRLDQWRGDAKSALVAKISDVTSHLTLSASTAASVLQQVGALYYLAYRARGSLLDLCRESTAAADREIENQGKRDAKLALASLKEVVTAVLAIPSGNMATTALTGIVGVTAATADHAIEGNDADAVAENYIRAGDFLTAPYVEMLDDARRRLRAIEGEYAFGLVDGHVYRPVAGDADIESPDFRYESFASAAAPPPVGFEGAVERERTTVVEDRRRSESEIERRLAGAS